MIFTEFNYLLVARYSTSRSVFKTRHEYVPVGSLMPSINSVLLHCLLHHFHVVMALDGFETLPRKSNLSAELNHFNGLLSKFNLTINTEEAKHNRTHTHSLPRSETVKVFQNLNVLVPMLREGMHT